MKLQGTEKQVEFANQLIEKAESRRGTKKESKFATELQIIDSIPENANAGNVIDVLNADSGFQYNYRMVEKMGQPIEKAIEHVNA